MSRCDFFFLNQGEETGKSAEVVLLTEQICLSEDSTCASQDKGNMAVTTWKKEEEYLKTLTEQYCLEEYQDSYDLMCEQSLSEML